MSPKELKKLVKTLRESGVTHYECAEFKLDLSTELPTAPNKHAPLQKSSPTLDDKEIEHKILELKSVMALDDMELIDRLWPLPVDTEEETG